MKIHYFFILFAFNFFTIQAQNVNIPDEDFKSFLVNFICADLDNDSYPDSDVDTNNDGEIQISEAEAVFMLDINQNCLATSLEGLSAFNNLVEIKCENSLVNTLDLSFITQISEIEVSSNPNLTSINLGQLAIVDRHITFDLNPNLESINLLNLTNVGGRFVYRYNATTSNTTINLDLSNLESIGSNLYITDNDSALPMSIDLSSLVNVNQSMIINDNNISTIDFSSLTYIHGFRFNNNTTITELNLSNVVSNDTYITSNDEISIQSYDLTSIDLSSLEYSVKRMLIYNSLMTVDLSSLNYVLEHIVLSYDSPNISLPNFQTGDITIAGDIQQIDLNAFENGDLFVNTDNDDLNAIDLSSYTIGDIYLNHNQLTEINLPSLVSATKIDLRNNNLTSINIPVLEIVDDLMLGSNQLDDFELSNTNVTGVLDLSSNSLTNLNLTNNTIGLLLFMNSEFTSLDLSTTILQSFIINDTPYLIDINLKNGDSMGPVTSMSNITITDVPNLSYICVDSGEFDYISSLDIENCQINSYCSFVPGGHFYTIEGENKYDLNANGCDSTDSLFPNLSYSITDGTTEGDIISNTSGNYSIPLQAGIYDITPNLINPDYFLVNPETITVNFPEDGSEYSQDFCVTSNGEKNDLQTYIIPLSAARPGFDSTYKIVYKNVGNTTLSGNITFSFEDDYMDFISSTPAVTNQITNELSWDFSNIQPFENRFILVDMNLNPPTHPTHPLNDGNQINFSTSISPINNDENIGDNSMGIKQTVVNSFDPNDITCLEGPTILENEVNKYVHYKIRFENTGSASAVNIVVKDIIDETKFDLSSFLPLEGSHSYITRITNSNEVEFIFENIQLPFDDANNDGYVVFKIKTLPSLTLGDTFENRAEIYFDFNFPIITNIYTTDVVDENLSTEDYINQIATIYPNPVKDILTIRGVNQIKSVSIFTLSGQLLIEHIGNTNKLDLSKLNDGIYFLKIKTGSGDIHKKIIKS